MHRELHRSDRIGWLRAATLGANDGLISTSSLIVGVASGEPTQAAVLLAAVAGLAAGALSMAAGEYVSVSSQADTEQADLSRERGELAASPEAERAGGGESGKTRILDNRRHGDFDRSARMPSHLDPLMARIAQLERDIEHELNEAREKWHYRIEAGRIRFERDVQLLHRRLKQGIPRFIRESSLQNALTGPVIYSLAVPIALLDLWISLYQTVCFPVYGIARVRRSAYIVIDRQHLAYLNGIEKLNCVYCGYVNGVFAYVREIGGRTEQYWCPIRHATRVQAPHPHYREFVDYGDAAGYKTQLPLLRARLKDPGSEEK